jgi:diguanylate cyclase (GGDEF)-like protein
MPRQLWPVPGNADEVIGIVTRPDCRRPTRPLGASSGQLIRSRVNAPLLIDRVADTTSHRDRDSLDRAIVQMLVEFLDSPAVTLYVLLQDESHTRMVRRAGYDHGSLQVRPRLPVDLVDLPRLADRPEWQACVARRCPIHGAPVGGHSTVCFPVEEGSNVVGLLEIEVSDSMSARETRLVEGILRILRNQTALLDYGERDTLTGLLNRKTFESRFARICGELPDAVSSASQPYSWLGILDIDHFKTINDTYGHVIGDEVLLLVSQIMQRTLRGSDQLFRFGGEEFVVVLEDTNATGANIAFERIRAAIEHHNFPQVGKVTASLGFTTIRRQEPPTSCVERADEALYFIKRNGRNGVRCFEHLVESGEMIVKDNSGDVELF